jgi:hypothetical protein
LQYGSDNGRYVLHIPTAGTNPKAQSEDEQPMIHQEASHAWDDLSKLVPARIKAMPLAHVDLPTRMRTFVLSASLVSIGDLLQWSCIDLLRQQPVGEGTMLKTLAVIRQLTKLQPTSSVADLPHCTVLLREQIAMLPARAQRILRHRSLSYDRKEVGKLFGVSHQAIRMRELAAVATLQRAGDRSGWRQQYTDLLNANLQSNIIPLDKVRSTVLRGPPEQSPEIAYFINEVLACGPRVVTIRGKFFLTWLTPDQLREARLELELAARRLVYPVPAGELDTRLLAELRSVCGAKEWTTSDVGLLRATRAKPWVMEGRNYVQLGNEWRKAKRNERQREIVAFVERRQRPVKMAELIRRFPSARQVRPSELVSLRPGLVTVAKHIDGWDAWLARLVPASKQIMKRSGAARQWSSQALLLRLEKRFDLPEWLNASVFGSMLRLSGSVLYVGRNVVALQSAKNRPVRARILPLVVELLTAHGKPMLDTELKLLVEGQRAPSINWWNSIRRTPPLLILSNGMVGLAPRDLPCNERALARLCNAAAEKLKPNQRMYAAELQAFARTVKGVPAEALNPATLGSILRMYGRFKTTGTDQRAAR